MELRHLRYFVAVAEEGSLTVAAERQLDPRCSSPGGVSGSGSADVRHSAETSAPGAVDMWMMGRRADDGEDDPSSTAAGVPRPLTHAAAPDTAPHSLGGIEFALRAGMETKLSEHGTLVIAALLLLALGFAGDWIDTYVTPDADPRAALPWFALAALAIIVVGLFAY